MLISGSLDKKIIVWENYWEIEQSEDEKKKEQEPEAQQTPSKKGVPKLK